MGSFHIALLVCLCLVIWRFLYQKHICITLFGAMGCIWCFPVSKLMLGKKSSTKVFGGKRNIGAYKLPGEACPLSWTPFDGDWCRVSATEGTRAHEMSGAKKCIWCQRRCLVPRNVSGAYKMSGAAYRSLGLSSGGGLHAPLILLLLSFTTHLSLL